MKELNVLLQECIDLTDEIYRLALVEELDNVRNSGSLFVNKLKIIISKLIECEIEIDPIIIHKTEKLVEAINVGDCIATMDIILFEMKPILNKYLESVGERVER
jgi:hypothetical protein